MAITCAPLYGLLPVVLALRRRSLFSLISLKVLESMLSCFTAIRVRAQVENTLSQSLKGWLWATGGPGFIRARRSLTLRLLCVKETQSRQLLGAGGNGW